MAVPIETEKTASQSPSQAGVSLDSGGRSNSSSIRHNETSQAERVFSVASTLVSGIMAISACQFVGTPLKFVDSKVYETYMAWMKESFAVLMTTITQLWAPTVVRVSGDESMKGQLFLMDDGTLKCNFPHRLILIANHQLYTDWLYLWWIAYTNKMHGRIYIILKESLKRVPIVGWGMQFYKFIFLSRKWEQDRDNFKKHLNHLKNCKDPMWLLIFPEGTNLSAVTRERSAKWAEKNGIEDMKHQLLPRKTGLQCCLQELRPSTNWLYDCTIAYEGVPQGMYGQDIFTLKSSLFEGRPPKSVNMYWRRFKTSEIPYDDDEQFSRWLLNRWREKDYILEYYYKFGNFPVENPSEAMLSTKGKQKPVHAKAISSSVKGGGWNEFLNIFGPITAVIGALSSIDITVPVNLNEMTRKVAQSQQCNLLQLGKAQRASKAPGSDKLMSDESSNDLGNAAGLFNRGVKRIQQKGTPLSTARASVQKEVALTSVERSPSSTTALHAAGQNVKSVAAQQAQRKGSALSGQLPSLTTKISSTSAVKYPITASKIKLPIRTSKTVAKTSRSVAKPASAISVKPTPVETKQKPVVMSSSTDATKKVAIRDSNPMGV